MSANPFDMLDDDAADVSIEAAAAAAKKAAPAAPAAAKAAPAAAAKAAPAAKGERHPLGFELTETAGVGWG